MGEIALADGCFDPLHPGHLKYLSEARRIAYDLSEGTLVCKVASDRYLATKHPPLLNQQERAELVAGYVDDVLLEDITTAEAIVKLRPKLYIKGCDWRSKLPHEEVNAAKAVGCEIEFTNTASHSSRRILDTYREETEALGLEWFEAFMANQKAPEPFDEAYFERQGFTLEKRREIEGNHPWVIRSTFAPTNVLDYGCGPGHLITLLKESGVSHVDGYDPSPVWGQTFLNPPYDLVICREVLEHIPVSRHLETVSKLCSLSSRFVYVTTRFHPHPRHVFDISPSDRLDPTHISLPNKTLLRALFTLHGMKRRKDLEKQIDHMKKGRCLVYEH